MPSDISRFAPEVLDHAKDLLRRMRDYESIASPAGYEIEDESYALYALMVMAGLNLASSPSKTL